MSGPKISVYSLTGRAGRNISEQMRCDRESAVCYSQAKEMVRALRAFAESVDQKIKTVEILMRRTSAGGEQIEELLALKEKIQTELAEIESTLSSNVPLPTVKYTVSEDTLAQKTARLKRLQALQTQVKRLKDRADALSKQHQKASRELQSRILKDLEAAEVEDQNDAASSVKQEEQAAKRTEESILADLSGIFSFDESEEPANSAFLDKKVDIRQTLAELLDDSSLSADIRSDVQNGMAALDRVGTVQHLSTFETVTMTGILRRAAQFRAEAAQRAALSARYEALCEIAGEEPRPLPDSGAEAKAEVERMEALAVRRREQAYISECVDEVMAEMGYDLIGAREVRKKSGKRFRSELFSFHEGTAVNVTFSSDGQIAMEIGGLSREDRLPSAEETAELTRDMEHFCDEFAEFERRLLARGIAVGTRIALSPPTAEYAAVINVDDYELAETAQVTMLQAKEKRKSGKATVRRHKNGSAEV